MMKSASNQQPPDQKGEGILPEERMRLRIRFGKTGPLRFISHLDLHKVWERLLRRAGVPLTYSQGYSPHPHLQLAAALPLGYFSTYEIADIISETSLPCPLEDLKAHLEAYAPEGLVIYSIKEAELKHKALQALTESAVYEARLRDGVGDLGDKIDALLAEKTIQKRKRNGKEYNLREMVLELEQPEEGLLKMKIVLSQQKGSARADAVLEELGLEQTEAEITRTAILFSREID